LQGSIFAQVRWQGIEPITSYLMHASPIIMTKYLIMALFIWLIIRLIQLVFSARTVFFSHKKSANSVFQPAYNSSRMRPIFLLIFMNLVFLNISAPQQSQTKPF
jgi:hypothetical protein